MSVPPFHVQEQDTSTILTIPMPDVMAPTTMSWAGQSGAITGSPIGSPPGYAGSSCLQVLVLIVVEQVHPGSSSNT
jgi:hypothetical protein